MFNYSGFSTRPLYRNLSICSLVIGHLAKTSEPRSLHQKVVALRKICGCVTRKRSKRSCASLRCSVVDDQLWSAP